MSVLTEFLTEANPASFLVALGAGLTVVLVYTALATMRSPVHLRTSARLAALSTPGSDSIYQPADALRDRRVSSIPLMESLLGGRSWVDGTRDTLGRAGLPLRVGEYVALRALAVTLCIGVGLFIAERVGGEALARLFFAVVGAGTGWSVPALMVKMRVQRRRQQIETQLIELCDVMASMLQAGYGYVQALNSTAEEVGPPLSTELQRLLDAVRLGGDIDEALDELNERLGSRDFDMIASAISIQRRSGGNLAEILTGVADTIRHRQSFFREVRALTSKERLSAIIVAGFPLGLIAVLTLMNPEIYGLLFTDTIGRIILGAAVFLDFIGFLIIRKMTQVEV